MHADFLYGISVVAGAAPFLAIAVIVVHYQMRRIAWRRKRRRGKKNPGFCPSSAAMGMILLFTQVFYRPSVEYVLAERQDEDADEDDQGDPESPDKQLHRQLRRIRRGEPVERIVLHL